MAAAGPVMARVVPPNRPPATPETAAVTSPTSGGTSLATAMARERGTAMHPTVIPAAMSVNTVDGLSILAYSGRREGRPRSASHGLDWLTDTSFITTGEAAPGAAAAAAAAAAAGPSRSPFSSSGPRPSPSPPPPPAAADRNLPPVPGIGPRRKPKPDPKPEPNTPRGRAAAPGGAKHPEEGSARRPERARQLRTILDIIFTSSALQSPVDRSVPWGLPSLLGEKVRTSVYGVLENSPEVFSITVAICRNFCPEPDKHCIDPAGILTYYVHRVSGRRRLPLLTCLT